MYFKDRNNTNIDNDFNNNSVALNILNFINKYKIILIFLILITSAIILFIMLSNRKITNYLTLIGESTITIYQDSEYIEPGYYAYNSKDKDLTSDVSLTSNLDTSKIGVYEINYTIEDITKTRIISVIEKPKEYTYIYLNAVNNSKTVYLKRGEEYKEPGYKVFNSTGVDLTSKAKVEGNVDTSKVGTYKLIYSVIDNNNVKTTAERIVIVMDTEVSLSLTPNNYTNKEVIINIGIIDNYFDYILLPNNQKITNNIYEYKVNENGKYTFKIYNKKGTVKEESIEVKNIDKDKPTGNCEGTYGNRKTILNITATDKSDIDKYVINGTSYTSNQIIIDKELNKVNVSVYDKAGNINDISCVLEQGQVSKPSSSSSKSSSSNKSSSSKNSNSQDIDKIYTSDNSHTSSINNIRYLLYNQTDPRWASYGYDAYNSNIGEMGCHITSAAVIASAYNENITPLTVYNGHSGSYPYTSINALAGKGFECKQINATNSKDKILSALFEGKSVVIMVYGKKKGGDNLFTTGQHYMALIDYKDDKIFVGNSYSTSTYGKSGWFNKDSVLTSIKEVNICTPQKELLEKFN